MEIILVHWLIKEGKEAVFENHWRTMMKPGKAAGFYREILTRPISKPDPKFNTFSITDRNYVTYINIGIWRSMEDFDTAIRQWIPSATDSVTNGRIKRTIELEDFEYKLRERVVLEHVADRGGSLPEPILFPNLQGH